MDVNKYFKVVRKNNGFSIFVAGLFFVSLLASCFFRDYAIEAKLALEIEIVRIIFLSIGFTSAFITANTRVWVLEDVVASKWYLFQYHPLDLKNVYLTLARKIAPYLLIAAASSIAGSFVYDCKYRIIPAALVLTVPYLTILIKACYDYRCIGRRSENFFDFLIWMISCIFMLGCLMECFISAMLICSGTMDGIARIFAGTGSDRVVLVTFQYGALTYICRFIVGLFVVIAIFLRERSRKLLIIGAVVVALLYIFTVGINILNYTSVEEDTIYVVKNGKRTEYSYSEVANCKYHMMKEKMQLEVTFTDGTKTEVLGKDFVYSKSFAEKYGVQSDDDGDRNYGLELMRDLKGK